MGLTSLGIDLGGVTDLSSNLAFVSEGDCLLEAVVTRWLTPTGGLWLADDYGGGLFEILNSTDPPMRALERKLVVQAKKDERVEDCQVLCEFLSDTNTIEVSASITAVTGETFDLTLSIDQVTTTVLMTKNQTG